MEVIDDCTVFFFGILPHTLLPTGKNSSPSSPFRTRKLKKKTVVLKFLELNFSCMPPSTQSMTEPTLYSTQLIVIGEGPASGVGIQKLELLHFECTRVTRTKNLDISSGLMEL